MSGAADVGHVDFLAEIPQEIRKTVLAHCVRTQFKSGRMVWLEGDSPKFIAFIEQGKALSMYHASNGRVGATGIWAAGDILGGASMYQPRRRQTAIKCLEPTVLLCLDLNKLHDITTKFPEVGHAITGALSARLRWANHLIHLLQTLSAFERVSAIILSLSERFAKRSEEGIVIDVPLTHEDLAALVGVTRQFTTAALHELKEQGIVALYRRTIVLRDDKKLRKLVRAA